VLAEKKRRVMPGAANRVEKAHVYSLPGSIPDHKGIPISCEARKGTTRRFLAGLHEHIDARRAHLAPLDHAELDHEAVVLQDAGLDHRI